MPEIKKAVKSTDEVMETIMQHLRFQTQTIFSLYARQIGRTAAQKQFDLAFPPTEEAVSND